MKLIRHWTGIMRAVTSGPVLNEQGSDRTTLELMETLRGKMKCNVDKSMILIFWLRLKDRDVPLFWNTFNLTTQPRQTLHRRTLVERIYQGSCYGFPTSILSGPTRGTLCIQAGSDDVHGGGTSGVLAVRVEPVFGFVDVVGLFTMGSSSCGCLTYLCQFVSRSCWVFGL